MDASVPSAHIRIARPSGYLDRAERFWVDGLGLEVLHRAGPEAEGGKSLLMVGWAGAAWHLELVADPTGEAMTRPTEEDLLVLYLGDPVDDGTIDSLEREGGRRVTPDNPYWDHWGITVEDPDGYRLVLCSREWG